MLGGAVMLLALAAASALPHQPSRQQQEEAATAQQPPSDDVLYDQRQNGTENIRVQMSDVTLMVAPAEALLSIPSDLFQSQIKPKLADSGKTTRSKHKLAHFLMNVLHRNQH